MFINKELVNNFPKIPVIYRIYNIESNKGYIGKCAKGIARILDHFISYKRPKSEYRAKLLYRAIKKHNIEKFNWEILEITTLEKIDEKEIFYIKEYNSCNPKMGYNITEGGTGGYTLKHFSKEQKQIVFEKRIETRKKSLEKDPHFYDYQKQKCSESLKAIRACPIKSAKNREMSRQRLLKLNKNDPRFMKRSKKCIHIESGRVFNSIKDMSIYFNINTRLMVYYIHSGKTRVQGTFKLISTNLEQSSSNNNEDTSND